MTAAVPHLRLVGEGKACSCPDLTGELTCSECDGKLYIVHPREQLLVGAVVEAARTLMAAQLRLERAQGVRIETDHELVVADAWQGLRDVLFDQRKSRGGAR